MMNEQDAVNLLKAADSLGIILWIGGGWGVSALIGSQIRPHDDIDVYIEKKNADVFIRMLTSKGYCETKTEYTTQAHTVWKNPSNNIVDLHLFELKEEYADSLYFEGEAYPLFVLDGTGTIGGVEVQCFTAEAQVLFHQGYGHSEKDTHDVLFLCKSFGLDVPEEYKIYMLGGMK